MSDIFTTEKRSEIMSHSRSKNNKSTELKLIKIFKEYGIHGSNIEIYKLSIKD